MEQQEAKPDLRDSGGWKGSSLSVALCDMGLSGRNRYRTAVVGGARVRVLEIGVGSWMNLPYYSREIASLTGIEPDAAALHRARKRAEKLGRQVELLQGRAEALPFPDESFDTVVGTLVFCTVGDVQAGLQEIMRVLKPGGEYRFWEHVRSETAWAANFQDWMTPLWKRCVRGCHLNRSTEQSIRAAGFEIVDCQHRGMGVGPLMPALLGVAKKP